MATPNVSSIVDFLKSRGFNPEQGERFPLFQQRKRIFEQLGLQAEQTEFRGTAQENLNLLTRLSQRERESGVSISPENIVDMTRATQPTVPTQLQPTQVPPPTAQDTTALQGVPTVPEGPDLAQQALQTIQRGATFPLRQEAVEAEKAGIRLAGQQNIEQTIKSFASRGLFFSGARKKEVSNVEADTLARVLGVDRKFALLIAQGLESAAQDIAKEAQKGRAEAISSLGALGFVILPDGRIVQKPSERRAEAAGLRAERADIRAEEAGVRAERAGERAAVTAERVETERGRDNARAILNNEALFNSLSPADQQATWNRAGLTGQAPAKLTGKVQGTEFLNTDFFKRTFTEEQLEESAKKAGFETEGGVFGIGKEALVDEYLVSVEAIVKTYRDAGFNDREILKLMQ